MFSWEIVKVGKTISKFFLYNAIPFIAAGYYQAMINTIAEADPNIKGPDKISDWQLIFGGGSERS